MAGSRVAFDHIHIISRNPEQAAAWYVDFLGGEITDSYDVRGAPQIAVSFGDAIVLIRGQRPGEAPGDKNALNHFDGFVSHDQWGTDHFGFQVSGDFFAFCDGLRDKGAKFSVEPVEFVPGRHIAYLEAPDGVTVELVEPRK